MPVVAYFSLVSLNIQLNPMAATWRDSILKKKIPHWKMVMLNVMNFQILLPLIPLEDIGMGVTINACFKFVHFFLSIKFILSILPSILRPTKRKRRYLMYLNYFSRNNSRVIYNENTGFSPKWQI